METKEENKSEQSSSDLTEEQITVSQQVGETRPVDNFGVLRPETTGEIELEDSMIVNYIEEENEVQQDFETVYTEQESTHDQTTQQEDDI